MAYCTAEDLLVGDITLAAGDGDKYVNLAAEEMDTELAYSYVLPLPDPMPIHAANVLKRINLLIASGRLLLASTSGSEMVDVHAYGRSLLDEGKALLHAIASGALQLTGAVKIEAQSDVGNAPTIINFDATSAVDAFYAAVTADPWTIVTPWKPGP